MTTWERLQKPLLGADAAGDSFGPRSAVVLLMFTICLETAGTLTLKRSGDGVQYYVIAYACYFVSFGLFSIVLRHIPLSIAYTTWCTLGSVFVSVMSYLLYDDRISTYKWACIGCTIPCVVGMYVLP